METMGKNPTTKNSAKCQRPKKSAETSHLSAWCRSEHALLGNVHPEAGALQHLAFNWEALSCLVLGSA